MADKTDLIQNLKNIGLVEDEITVFISLTNSSEQSAYQVSKSTNIPRTSVYRILENLVDKKVVESIISNNGNKYRVIKPSKLGILTNEKKLELEKYEDSIEKIENYLQTLSPTLPKTQIRYYQGPEGIKQIMWNALKAETNCVGYSVFGRIEVVGKSFIDKYNKEFAARKITDKVIISKREINRVHEFVNKGSLHKTFDNIRVISNKNFYVAGDTTIYNNIYAVCFWKHGEIIGVEIENPEIVKVQRGIFETLWDIATPLKKLI